MKAFLLFLIKASKRTLERERERDGELENHRLNEMGAVNMK